MKKIIHLFKYNFILFIKNKEFLFYMIAFPIMFITIYGLIFANSDFKIDLKEVKIGIIKDSNWDLKNNTMNHELRDEIYSKFTNSISNVIGVKTFDDKNDVQKSFENSEIDGLFILKSDNIKIDLLLTKNGFNQSIIKSISDSFNSNSVIVKDIIAESISKGEDLNNIDINSIFKDHGYENYKIIEKNIAGRTRNPYSINVYALLGYFIFLSINTGYHVSNISEANLSLAGRRLNSSGVKKYKVIISSFIFALFVNVLINVMLFVYSDVMFKLISFKDHFNELLILILIGSICATSIGTIIANAVKASENLKSGIVTIISLVLAFMSGMMVPSIKNIIDTNLPILNKLNPIALITDSMYSIFEFSDYNRFNGNIKILLLISIVSLIISIISSRRKNYDTL